MQKNTNKSFTFYLLIFGLFALLMNSFQSMMAGKGLDYSQIQSYFSRGEVEYFVLEGSDLTITLKDLPQIEGEKTIRYTVADPKGFMASRDFDFQVLEGSLSGYDWKPGPEDSALYDWMPTLISLGMCAFLFFTIFRQRSGGGGGPGANFGQAKTRAFTGGENSVTFRDVAGADE